MSTEGAGGERSNGVLFVCTANVCRSPMAEAIFNALAEDRSLPLRAESAGTAALRGEHTDAKAHEALAEVGIHGAGRRARQVDGAVLEEADLVLTMNPRQAAKLREAYEGCSHKIYSLSEYAYGAADDGIPDPHGHSLTSYRACVRQLFEHLDLVVDRLGRRRDEGLRVV